jgi:hypothetical protein
MKDLVITLTAQHQSVLRMVASINGKVQKGDVQGISHALGDLRDALLAHLELEDRELYPNLIRAAEKQNQPNIVNATKTFATNMIDITGVLKQFLVRFEGPKLDVNAFKPEWERIVGTLAARITSEESTLYPMFNQWMGSDQASR